MAKIVELRRAGCVDEAAELFAETGVLVIDPANHAVGRVAVRKGLASISILFPVFNVVSRAVIEIGLIALHQSEWTAIGLGAMGEPVELGGITSDVLERQEDGRWRVLIDNPWGRETLS